MRNDSQSPPPLADQIAKASQAIDLDAVIAMAFELVDTPSPFGYEHAVAALYREHLLQAGFEAEVHELSPGRSNVLGVRRGSGGGRSLMFNAHLDTCPIGPTISAAPPEEARVDGEWLLGSGIANMKGVLAAYIGAVSAIDRAGLQLSGDVLISGTAGGCEFAPVDEHQELRHRGFGVGTADLLARGGVADMCVLGDPTSFRMARTFFGASFVRVEVTQAENVVPHMEEVLAKIRAWTPHYQRAKGVGDADAWVSVLGVRDGTPWTWNFRNDRCTIYLAVATPPEAPPMDLVHELRGVLAPESPSYQVRVDLYSANPGSVVPEDADVAMAVSAAHSDVFGAAEPELIGSPAYCHIPPLDAGIAQWFCDANHFNRYGIPTVNYGPHALLTADEGEKLRVDDLLSCIRVYVGLIIRACGTA